MIATITEMSTAGYIALTIISVFAMSVIAVLVAGMSKTDKDDKLLVRLLSVLKALIVRIPMPFKARTKTEDRKD